MKLRVTARRNPTGWLVSTCGISKRSDVRSEDTTLDGALRAIHSVYKTEPSDVLKLTELSQKDRGGFLVVLKV